MKASRTLYAAGLLGLLLAALLGAWFVSGWHDVRMRQQELTRAPHVEALQRTGELAHELQRELEALVARESRRPYFHYQNLMHDPQASPGLNVTPSPLARGPGEELVRGYFQVDAKGDVTTPTINQDLPELSSPEQAADHREFLDQVRRELSGELTPVSSMTATTRLADAQTQPGRREPGQLGPVVPVQASVQTLQIPRSAYAQNLAPNTVYSSQTRIQMIDPQAQSALEDVLPKPAGGGPVTITISPFEWRTLSFDGARSLIATREVQTPDGPLSQGFVVERATLAARLAARAGDLVADFSADDSQGVPVAPGWSLRLAPSARAVAQAADEARLLADTFIVRFVGVGSLAALAAGLIVVLVMRAETVAFERSRFAAAAAHELRTPLAGLQLYGELLADGLGDPAKARDYARRMSEEASRLGRVVSNVLGFSELEFGTLSVDACPGPLGEVMGELVDRARPALERAGAVLQLDVPADLRATFDRDALTRIVGNLLDNAEKYSRHSPDRTIQIAALERGNHVQVTVADRGPGVTDRARLFQAFARGTTETTSPPGLGLGLALSISLARAMGGDLTYEPREGGGARFVVRMLRA